MLRAILKLALCVAATSAFSLTPSTLAPSAFRGVSINQAPALAAPRSRAAGPVMGIKDLRDRVSSVKNTKKITSAMRLVAAAKVRRAQDAVLKTRPFSETLQKVGWTYIKSQCGPRAWMLDIGCSDAVGQEQIGGARCEML